MNSGVNYLDVLYTTANSSLTNRPVRYRQRTALWDFSCITVVISQVPLPCIKTSSIETRERPASIVEYKKLYRGKPFYILKGNTIDRGLFYLYSGNTILKERAGNTILKERAFPSHGELSFLVLRLLRL